MRRRGKRKLRITRPPPPVEVFRPNERWSMDFVHDALENGSAEIRWGLMEGENLYEYANNMPEQYIDRDGRKPGDVFKTVDGAALDALTFTNAIFGSTGWEWSGVIYQFQSGPFKGEYSYTNPDTLWSPIESEFRTPPNGCYFGLPANGARVAHFHTHPRVSPADPNENMFSAADRRNAYFQQQPELS